MLTDVFVHRYDSVTLRDAYVDRDARLMVQLFRLLEEHVQPYWVDGKADKEGEVFWSSLHSKISMELGLTSLSQEWIQRTYGTGANTWSKMEKLAVIFVCKNWMLAPVGKAETADEYIKNRLSLVELSFRMKEETIAHFIEIYSKPTIEFAGTIFDSEFMKSTLERYQRELSKLTDTVDELNERLRRAGYPLHYHNGFFQFSEDRTIRSTVEQPFWSLVADPKWQNVDIDMKEAIDRRDTGGRDPGFYAGRALESTIKIISGEKGWTRGGEKGAHQYIDNLVSAANGRFIEVWEAEQIKSFFTHVRNPLGHGPGGEPMPGLTLPQTDWAIAFCMAWVRSLIIRM
jgi:hypothetical protein